MNTFSILQKRMNLFHSDVKAIHIRQKTVSRYNQMHQKGKVVRSKADIVNISVSLFAVYSVTNVQRFLSVVDTILVVIIMQQTYSITQKDEQPLNINAPTSLIKPSCTNSPANSGILSSATHTHTYKISNLSKATLRFFTFFQFSLCPLQKKIRLQCQNIRNIGGFLTKTHYYYYFVSEAFAFPVTNEQSCHGL